MWYIQFIFDLTIKSLEYDVKQESNRIEHGDYLKQKPWEEPIVLRDLKKVYKRKGHELTAVKNLSFGVLTNECFG